MDEWGGEWLPKAFVYGGLLVAVGVLVAHWLLQSLDVRASEAARHTDTYFARIGVVGATVALIALLARALFHTATSFGWPDAFLWENLRLVAMESRWGGSWQLQVCAAAAVVAVAFAARRWASAWIAYVGAVAALSLSIPLVGHAAGSWARYLLHAVHIVAGGAWLGTLAVLITLRGTAESISKSTPGDLLAPLIQRFSPLALSAATATAITGTIAAFLYVASFHNLVSSTYGRMLLLKILCVVFVAACGSLNWRRVRAGEVPLAGVMLAEVVAALVVVMVTSVLTETEHP